MNWSQSSDENVDYQARHHEVEFEFTPYYGAANLNFTSAQQTLKLQYKRTVLYTDSTDTATSGLNPLSILSGNPQLPIARTDYKHLSIDAEGIVLLDNGS